MKKAYGRMAPGAPAALRATGWPPLATLRVAGLLVAGMLTIGSAVAPARALDQPLVQPQGPVILILSGKLGKTNVDGEAHFDMDMLERLPLREVRTDTPWTEGTGAFEGPLVRDVLAAAGADGTSVTAIAHNDYRIAIPMNELDAYDIILASRKDGVRLTLRERGPLWIIYPWNDNPQLKSNETVSRAVWQLKRLHVD